MATEVAPLELGEAAMVPGGALGRPIRGTARELWGGQAVETGAVVFSLPTRRRVTASGDGVGRPDMADPVFGDRWSLGRGPPFGQVSAAC